MSALPDAVVSLWDTIDDDNNNLSAAPAVSLWSSDNVSDSTNFSNISAAGNSDLTPPNTTPTGTTAAFSQIWRGDLTILLYTTPLQYTDTTWVPIIAIPSTKPILPIRNA